MGFKLLYAWWVLSGFAWAATPYDVLPVSGLKIKQDKDWLVYSPPAEALSEPFERIWMNPRSNSKRTLSTHFENSREICLREQVVIQKAGYLIKDIVPKPNGYLCAFKGLRGSEAFFVAIKEVIRSLPKKRKFISQSVLVESSSDEKSFLTWIASAQEIKKR